MKVGTHVSTPLFTRRSFLSLLAATGTVIAVGDGENLLVRVAHADEDGLGDPYTLYVVKRWEVPFYVFDVTDPNDPKPVPNAAAHITSLYNGKIADAITDANGVAVVDVRELCEPDEDQRPGEQQYNYRFFGQVTVEKSGYRTFETGKMRFTGGQEIAVATEPLDGRPYARMATFDGWDIQYADSATFAATTANRDTHEIVVKSEASDGKAIRVTAFQENGASFQTDASPDVDGIAAATLEGRFLSTNADDADHAFEPGKPVFITVAADAGRGQSFTFESNLVIEQGHFDEASFTPGQSIALDELMPNGSSRANEALLGDLSITLPESIPVIGGGPIKLPIPVFPVTIDIDPLSYIFIGAKLSSSLHKGTDGRGDKNIWTRDTKENGRVEAARTTLNAIDYYDMKNAGIAPGDKKSAFTKVPGGFGFSPSLEVGFGLYQTWNDEELVWRGDLKGYADLELALSYTLQFFIASVPVYVGFEFTVDAYMALQGGVETVESSNGIVPQFSGGGGFTFTPKLEIAVSAGVGVSGGISVGVRGSGFLSFTVNALFAPRGKPNPHMNLDGGIDVALCAQFLLYKGSIPLYAGRWPNIYTNWPEDKASNASFSSAHEVFYVKTSDGLGYSASSSLALQEGASVNAAFVPVTEDELAATAELRAVTQNEEGDGTHTYEEARSESATTGLAYSPMPLALGAEGVQPKETKVYQDVFSDPRQKAFTVDGTLWIARLVPVVYAQGTRTRLTVAKMEGGVMGAPKVLEFNFEGVEAPCSRVDTFDCDFDVLGCDDGCGQGKRWQDGGAFRILLTMVTRPDGDASSIASVASHSVAAFLSVGDDLSIKTRHLFFDDYDRTNQPSILLHPRLIGSPYFEKTVAFALHRIAAEGKTVFDSGYKEFPSDCMFNSDGTYTYTKQGFSDVPENRFSDSAGLPVDATEILTDAKQDVAVVVLEHTLWLKYLLCYNLAVSDDEKQAPIVKAITVLHHMGSSHTHTATVVSTNAGRAHSLRPWSGFRPAGTDSVLLADGRSLTALWHDKEIRTQAVQLDKSIQLDNFALSKDGALLYFASVFDGKQEDEIDQDGNRTPGEVVNEYRIRASRVVMGESGEYRFMRPFTIARIDHPADSLIDLSLPNSYGFLSNSITNLAESVSDLYLYSVPKLAHLSLIGFAPLGKTVCAGTEETFHVSVRNDGNTAIDSFVLVISDESDEVGRITVNIPEVDPVLEAKDVANDSDALLGWYGAVASEELELGEGAYPNPVEAQPVADIPTEAGVVLPGETRTYRFSWMIPEAWHGETPVDVRIDLESLTLSTQPGCSETEEAHEESMNALQIGMELDDLEHRVSANMPVLTAQYEDIESIPVGRTPYQRSGDPEDGNPESPGSDKEPGGKPAKPNGGPTTAETPFAQTGDSLTDVVAATLAVAIGAGSIAEVARKMSKQAAEDDDGGKVL